MPARLMTYLAAAPIVLMAFTPAGPSSGRTPAASPSLVLATNHCLGPSADSDQLYSPSGVFELVAVLDSVILEENEQITRGHYASTTDWRRPVTINPAYRNAKTKLCMRSNGDLSLLTVKGHLLWSSHTRGTGRHNYLRIQDDGNVVMRTAKGKVVWSSRTTRTILGNGTTIASGQHFVQRWLGTTPTWLTMRKDGDLVLRQGTQRLWSVRTRVRGAYAGLQAHGDFVIYAPSGRVLWRSRTHGRPSYLAVLNGCLTFETSYGAIWHRPKDPTCRAEG